MVRPTDIDETISEVVKAYALRGDLSTVLSWSDAIPPDAQVELGVGDNLVTRAKVALAAAEAGLMLYVIRAVQEGRVRPDLDDQRGIRGAHALFALLASYTDSEVMLGLKTTEEFVMQRAATAIECGVSYLSVSEAESDRLRLRFLHEFTACLSEHHQTPSPWFTDSCIVLAVLAASSVALLCAMAALELLVVLAALSFYFDGHAGVQ